MQFTKSELKNLIKEEVIRKKQIEDLEAKKAKLSEEYKAVLKECGMGGMDMDECDDMSEHGDGIGLGIKHLAGEGEKPSAGLSAKKRSSVVKAARAGKDIGKKGKGFKDVVANAKKSGAKDPEAVAGAAMWKNIKR